MPLFSFLVDTALSLAPSVQPIGGVGRKIRQYPTDNLGGQLQGQDQNTQSKYVRDDLPERDKLHRLPSTAYISREETR